MRLTTGRTKLKQAFENLMLRWEDTKEGWDDAARRAFEKDHLDPIAPDLTACLRATDRLSAIMSQMEHDCS